jgi:hypothetical protein
MQQDTRDHMWRMLLRLFLACVVLILRMVYAYYLNVDMMQPGPIQTAFWVWTCVICGLVFFIALPTRRSPINHPRQRVTDR